jgi:hypothetical protein
MSTVGEDATQIVNAQRSFAADRISFRLQLHERNPKVFLQSLVGMIGHGAIYGVRKAEFLGRYVGTVHQRVYPLEAHDNSLLRVAEAMDQDRAIRDGS